MRNFTLFYPIAIAQILLLCSCSLLPPSFNPSGDAPQKGSSEQAHRDSGSKPAADPEFNDHHEIIPAQSIEKGGLLVSYSMRAAHDKQGYLIRLSLIFRNLQDKKTIVRPKISLLDASGKKILVYSKTRFIRISSRLAGKDSESAANSLFRNDGKRKISEKWLVKWADLYWLKRSYRIPSQGIAIGELVYHSPQLNLPIRLAVNSNQQEFVFTTRGTLAAAGK